MVVREERPGGWRMHAVKRDADDYEGLTVERWEFTYLLPGGRYIGGMAIIAPDLKTPVVERRPDGLIRRLVNIKTGEADENLFKVPDGFVRLAPPQHHKFRVPAAPTNRRPPTSPPETNGDGPFAGRGGPKSSSMLSTKGDTAGR